MKPVINIKPKTPIKISGSVKNLVKELGLNTKPVYLPLCEVEGTRAGYCFNNCEDYIRDNAGEIVYGWIIWEDRKNRFIEAEFHALIKYEGRLMDITPRFNAEKKVLFVEDDTRISGRKDKTTWHSWTNIKLKDGFTLEFPAQIEIRELDNDYSEVVYL
ncbi:hypothetical protein ACQ8YR_002652 [Yersinia enterocolitica]|nr:hypothetical protein [Yersinia enterocolitica]EKN5021375.1 hypothetical protein [Yersinia enterocolitica]EKN5065948.1 hypothetical protein [Yersinia enterocolitica]EKN5131657.1 hypothetical protein [Yersinia enterocolitica]HDL6991989.1 hypothetical protein [Yersinia enterocolitica]